jgi:hypothetical protein
MSRLVLQIKTSHVEIGNTSEETTEAQNYVQDKCASSKEKCK